MNKTPSKQYIYSVVVPLVCTVAGGLAWWYVYSQHHTSAIKFDGPAGGMLLMSTVGGALLGFLSGLLFSYYSKVVRSYADLLKFMITALITCFFMGILVCFAIGSYAMHHYKSPSYSLYH